MSGGDGAAIAEDPFWSAFRRRHPDVDVVLVPDPHERQVSTIPRREPGVDPESFLRSQLATLESLWTQLVGRAVDRRDSQWIPGAAKGLLRCSLTFTLEKVREREGLEYLRKALDALPSDGWYVFAPPTGMPRIHADRHGTAGKVELLFGYARETERLFVRLRSTGLPVSEEESRALLGGEA